MTADGAPLSEVLRVVARQAGFWIDGIDTLSEPVTVSFANVPLGEALRRLLVTQSYVVIEDEAGRGPESLASVRVFGLKEGAGPTSVPAPTGQGRPGTPPTVTGPAGAGETGISGEQEVRLPSEEELRRSAEDDIRRSDEEEFALRSRVFPD